MAKMQKSLNRLSILSADFDGLENLDNIIETVLRKLRASDSVVRMMKEVEKGNATMEQVDEHFAELIRVNLGRTLGILRAKAQQKADAALGHNRGRASVGMRVYKNGRGGNINILNPNRRKSNNRRQWTPGHQRDVSERTKNLNEYYGPDRAFILRILEGGRDEFMAHSSNGSGGRGSRATYGRRGAMAARPFFHTMHTDMEQAAQEMGETLVTQVEQWIDTQIKE